MRQAIAQLWEDPGLARQMGMAGRAHVEREFNPARVDARIRQTYAEVCAEFASPVAKARAKTYVGD
jgi:glycosyltransferase involved in cell wall biosynthesis